LQKCRKYTISKFILIFFLDPSVGIAPDSLMRRVYGDPLRHHSLGGVGAAAPSVPQLPYLEIKLTFECTASLYGLAPPLFKISTAYPQKIT